MYLCSSYLLLFRQCRSGTSGVRGYSYLRHIELRSGRRSRRSGVLSLRHEFRSRCSGRFSCLAMGEPQHQEYDDGKNTAQDSDEYDALIESEGSLSQTGMMGLVNKR